MYFTCTASSAKYTVSGSSARLVLPFSIDPAFRISPRSVTIHLRVVQRGCGPVYERPLLRRSPRRLTITLLARPWGPPTGRVIACPDFVAIRPISVEIGRPLGERAIYDGAFSPPREAAPAPG